MRKILLVGALMLSSLPSLAQDCNAVVTDNAQVFKSIPAIEQAAAKLQHLDADVHVISTNFSGPLDQKLSEVQQACPSWQQGDHQIKNNLVVFIVGQHRYGVYFGSQFKPALNGVVGSIKQNYMLPALKRHDFDAAMIDGITQTAIDVQGFNESILHPAVKQTIVTNQATDLHGFWVFLGFLLGLVAIGVAAFYLIQYIRFGQRVKEYQRRAVEAKNNAASDLIKTKNWLDEKTALGVDVISKQSRYDVISERFSGMTDNLSNDPGTAGLGIDTYEAIQHAYEQISDTLEDVRVIHSSYASTSPSTPHRSRASHHSNHTPHQPTSTPTPVAQQNYAPAPSYQSQYQPSTTVVVHDSSSDLLTGMIIGEELNHRDRDEDHYSRRDRDDDYSRPSYVAPDPEPDRSSSSSWGGSDNSYTKPDTSSNDTSWGGSDNTNDDNSSNFDTSSNDDSSFGGSDSSF